MKFSEILEIRNGKNQRNVENPNGNYPIYGSGGIMGWADDYICPANTVIIGRKGSINNPIYVEMPFWNVDTAFGLVSNDKIILPKYLYYFCRSFDFEALNTTVTIPSLTKANLLQIEIDVPPLDEQQNIVEILDSIEKSITLYNKQLAKLDTLVKSRFIEMFGDAPLSCMMKNVCKIITDGTHQPPKFVREGIPFIFVSNIVQDHLTYNAEKFIDNDTYNELIKRTPIEIGDVLLSTVGSYGHAAIVESERKFLFQRHIAYLKPDQDKINSRFMHSLILSDEVQRQIESKVKGIAQKTLNLSEIKSLQIPLPSLGLQNQFAAFVQQVDKSKSVLQKLLEKQELLRAALMQEYFG